VRLRLSIICCFPLLFGLNEFLWRTEDFDLKGGKFEWRAATPFVWFSKEGIPFKAHKQKEATMAANYDDDPWVIYRMAVPVSYRFCKLSTFQQDESEANGERGNVLCVHVPGDADVLFTFLQEEAETRSDLFTTRGPGALEYDFFPHVVTMACMPFYHRALMRATEVAVVCQITELCIERYERTLHGPNFNINRSRTFSHDLGIDYNELYYLNYADALCFGFALMTQYLHEGSPLPLHQICQRGARSIAEQYAIAVSRKWPVFYRQYIQGLFVNQIVDGRSPQVPFVVEETEE